MIAIAFCPAFASAEKIHRLGILSPGSSEAIRRVTIPELARRGFVEGRNLIIDEKLQIPASELDQEASVDFLALKPECSDRRLSPAVKALMANTRSVPHWSRLSRMMPLQIVSSTASPRPNGNVTGQSLQHIELSAKRMRNLETVAAWTKVRGAGFTNPE